MKPKNYLPFILTIIILGAFFFTVYQEGGVTGAGMPSEIILSLRCEKEDLMKFDIKVTA